MIIKYINILTKKTYFPDATFFLYAFIAVLLLITVLRFNDTKYLFERSYNVFTAENVARENKLASQRDTYNGEVKSARPQGKYEADIATFVLWGAVGAFLYWICSIVYKGFINPFVHDLEESHYINADKNYLLKKRLIWTLSTFFTFLLLALTVYIFMTIILSFYTIVIYETTVSSVAIFLFGIVLTTLMVAVLRVGAEIIAKTY